MITVEINSGEYFDENGQYQFDMSGVNDNQLLLGQLSWDRETLPNEFMTSYTKENWEKDNTRFIRYEEVSRMLRWMQQMNPNKYNTMLKNKAIICEDGTIYPVETDTPSSYLFIGIAEQLLD